jgi:predicted transcriptional regulator
MRPAGEIRAAIFQALHEQGPMPLVEIAKRVPVQTTRAHVKYTVENSVRAGLLEVVGHEKRAHCKKWISVYDVAQPQQPTLVEADRARGVLVLGDALGAWR